MSRSGYIEDYEDIWGMIRWRGAVKSAICGKRGQKALREILAALDAMPVKRLASGSLITEEGEYCTLGILGAHKGIALETIDPEDYNMVAKEFDIATALAREIVYENDEIWKETPESRWHRMREWVVSNIKGVL